MPCSTMAAICSYGHLCIQKQKTAAVLPGHTTRQALLQNKNLIDDHHVLMCTVSSFLPVQKAEQSAFQMFHVHREG